MNSNAIIDFIRTQFPGQDFIPLHAPKFAGREKDYLCETIDSTFVSSVGEFVNRFELELAKFTKSGYAVACVNGSNALHIALILAGVRKDDEVLTQALTFIATVNAISYCGANPVFIDVDRDTFGLSPSKLETFLKSNAVKGKDGFTYNKVSGNRIVACVPMHTFGLPVRIDEIVKICDEWNIFLIEDSAESLGSFYKGKHTGTFAEIGVFSFNGNKTITCGGGGAIITDSEEIAARAKHLTTQAKVPHRWKFMHDEIGYNYRMPNLNAALACAQLEQLDGFLLSKRELSDNYKTFFDQSSDVRFITEIDSARSNYWLNAILFMDELERDSFLEASNSVGVMTRPIWNLMNTLPMYKNCQNDGLENSSWAADRIVNIPSSVRN